MHVQMTNACCCTVIAEVNLKLYPTNSERLCVYDKHFFFQLAVRPSLKIVGLRFKEDQKEFKLNMNMKSSESDTTIAKIQSRR